MNASHKYKWYDTVKIPVKCCPLYSTLRIGLMLILRILPTVQIFVMAMFVDRALLLVKGKAVLGEMVLPIMLLAVLIICNNLGSILSNLLDLKIGNKFRLNYVEKLTQKCASLNYAEIENSETWDLTKRVKNKPDETLQRGFNSILKLAGIFLQLVGFVIVLGMQVWWSLPFVFFIMGVSIYCGMKGGERQYEAQREVTAYTRRFEYLGDILTDREAVDERSLFGFSERINNDWKKFYRKARKAELKVTRGWLVRTKALSSIMSLVSLAVALVLLYPIAKGTMSIGFYISLVQAANDLVSVMSWDLSDNINMYAKYKEYIKDYVSFMNLEECPGALELPDDKPYTVKTIEFKDVAFAYPGTQHFILDGINLKIEEGKHYAIVGRNGAGKTSLIKLLTGLYMNFEGEILINGKSIKQYEQSQLKAMVTVLFQDFARYPISLKDNIELGNVRKTGTEGQKKNTLHAICLLGLDKAAERLPKGIDTVLGKLDADGQDISGGEWQRVAMARTVVSPASLLVLDEPTAALDPMSESKMYEEFGKLGKGRTTLFISHRLGSTALADEIIVLDKGKVLEKGTHEALMEKCPLYREMYEDQRSWYHE